MAAPAIVIGSIVLIVGAFLDWASGTGGTSISGEATGTGDLGGYNLIDGRIAGAIGVGLLIAGLLMWANRRRDSWFDSDLLGVALSAFAIALIVMFLMDAGNEALSVDFGAYVSLLGAAIAFIGALAALLRSGSDRATADVEGRGDVGQRRVA
jgi:hypothetical protein